MRMSNAELQEAIHQALNEFNEAPAGLKAVLAAHVKALLAEQRRRAWTTEDMQHETLESAEFHARLRSGATPTGGHHFNAYNEQK